MSPPKKSPTNTDLSNQMTLVSAEIKKMNHRLGIIENWKNQEDAYKAALVQVHREQKEKNDGGDKILNKELMKALGLALTAIISLVALVQAAHK